jgi:hypothetical protein
MLSVYGWLCPRRAAQLPPGLWTELGLSAPNAAQGLRRDRIRMLDSRAWFSALQPKDRKLEV